MGPVLALFGPGLSDGHGRRILNLKLFEFFLAASSRNCAFQLALPHGFVQLAAVVCARNVPKLFLHGPGTSANQNMMRVTSDALYDACQRKAKHKPRSAMFAPPAQLIEKSMKLHFIGELKAQHAAWDMSPLPQCWCHEQTFKRNESERERK